MGQDNAVYFLDWQAPTGHMQTETSKDIIPKTVFVWHYWPRSFHVSGASAILTPACGTKCSMEIHTCLSTSYEAVALKARRLPLWALRYGAQALQA